MTMQRRQKRSENDVDKMKKHTLRAVTRFTALSLGSSPQHSQFQSVPVCSSEFPLHSSFRLTPVHSSFKVQCAVQSIAVPIQFRSVPITNRQSPIGCHSGRSRTTDGAAHRAADNCSRRRSEAGCLWQGASSGSAATSITNITHHTAHITSHTAADSSQYQIT